MAKAGDVGCMLFLPIACGKLYEESKQENKSRKKTTHSRGSEKLAVNKYEAKKSDLRQDLRQDIAGTVWCYRTGELEQSSVIDAKTETLSRRGFSF